MGPRVVILVKRLRIFYVHAIMPRIMYGCASLVF